MAKKQTAGRDHLGKLAPKFAELNDDILFGEVWSREEQLSARDRSMITIAALFSAGLYPQLKSHLALGKEHGITKEEAVDIYNLIDAAVAPGARRVIVLPRQQSLTVTPSISYDGSVGIAMRYKF